MAIHLIGAPSGQPPEEPEKRLYRVYYIVGVMLIVAGAAFAVKAAWPVVAWTFRVLTPFLIGLMLAYVFNPIVNWISRKTRLGRSGGLAIVAAIMALIIVGMATAVGVLATQVDDIYNYLRVEAPPYLARLIARVTGEDAATVSDTITKYLNSYQIDFQALGNYLPRMGRGAAGVAGGIASGIGALFSFFSVSIFAALITFYILIDFHKIPRVLRILIPDDSEDRIFRMLGRMDQAVGGFLRGQLIACSMVGLLGTIFMLIAGMGQWAPLIGLVAGITNFIPYLGPLMGATPAVIWAFFQFSGITLAWKLGLIIGSFIVIQMIDGLVFQPRIVGKHAELHPLTVLLALFVGGQFGLGGMILAVPMACIVRVLVKELWWDTLADSDRRRNLEKDNA